MQLRHRHPELFQSAPGGEAGGNASSWATVGIHPVGFNPPPAVRPGGTTGETDSDSAPLYNLKVQSAPGGEAGGKHPKAYPPRQSFLVFQSAPGGEAGGNDDDAGRPGRGLGFNPPPAVKPGGTCGGGTYRDKLQFQSAPGGEAGGNVPQAQRDMDPGHGVSIRPRR